MFAFLNKATGWLREEKGSLMVEYSLLVVLIAIVAPIAVAAAGSELSETSSEVASAVDVGT